MALCPCSALLLRLLGFCMLRVSSSQGVPVSCLEQLALSMHHLFLLASSPSCPVFCPQTAVDVHSSEWAHPSQFLFAQGPGSYGRWMKCSFLLPFLEEACLRFLPKDD